MPPRLAHRNCTLHHDRAVSLDALPMKSRCGNAPLPLVAFAIAGNQPFAQQNLHALLRALLDEVLRLHDEDLADELRLTHEDNVARPHAIVRHPAVRRSEVLKKQDRIAYAKESPREIEGQVEL